MATTRKQDDMSPEYKAKRAAKHAAQRKVSPKHAALIDAVKNPQQLAEEFLKRTRSLVERDGSFPPMAVVVHTNGKVMVNVFKDFDPSTQDALVAFLRDIANRPEIAYVFFITDSYVAVSDSPLAGAKRVKDLPGRKEAVVCTIMQKDDTATAAWVYDRNANNKPVFASDIEWYGQVSNNVVGSGQPIA